MSYDIYFVKSDNLNSENVDEFLESEANEKDEHFISISLMNEIKNTLSDKGLVFETYEGNEDNYLELNFESYQIALSSSQIAVSLPYWDVNGSGEIDSQVKLVSRVLIERGFVGYDPQTAHFYTDLTTFSTEFRSISENVTEHLPLGSVRERPKSIWWRIMPWVIFVLAFVLLKMLASLVSWLVR